MKFTQRDKKILVLGAIVAGIYFLVVFVIEPLYDYGQELSQKREDLRFRYEKSLKAVSQKAAVDSEHEQLKAIGAKHISRLINAKNANVAGAKLQQTLDGFLQKARLDTRSKKILKTEERDGFFAVPVELNATGTLSELRDFLERVMSDEMLLQVTKLDVRPENQRDPRKVIIEVVVVGFVLKETAMGEFTGGV